jgi:hypothetical protein
LANYYEADKDKQMEAVKRWIVAKKHQIRYNKDKNNEDDAKAQQIELDGILQEYNIPSRGDDISEYGNALEWAELCDIVIHDVKNDDTSGAVWVKRRAKKKKTDAGLKYDLGDAALTPEQIARNLTNINQLTPEQIAQATGLSVESIQKL